MTTFNTRNFWTALAAATLAAFGALPIAGAQIPSQHIPQWQIDAGGTAQFDVVSVKPDKSDAAANSNFPLGPGDGFAPSGGLFTSGNQPLVVYIAFAFKLRPSDLPSLPAWVYNDRFDIIARKEGSPTKDQMRLMMQSLLADRFRMKFHIETKDGPVYDLVLSKPGKTGPQLRRATEPCSATASSSPLQLPAIACGSIGPIPATAAEFGRLGGRSVTMARIADFLKNPYTDVDKTVIDRTGLAGTFDFSVEWALPADPTQPSTSQPTDSGPTFFEALQRQLGLKLQSAKGPVDKIVIDHIEPPTPN